MSPQARDATIQHFSAYSGNSSIGRMLILLDSEQCTRHSVLGQLESGWCRSEFD